ncbi:MAG: hypothetical protein ABI967_08045 [bacterium]
MPKDHENILFLQDEPLKPSEAPGFAPEAMVRCEECLRANPPTRVSCLYCAGPLPFDEKLADLRKPNLQPVENAALGYNIILIPQPATDLSDVDLKAAASLLQLSAEDLKRIVDVGAPLPLARTVTGDDAGLVCRRLKPLGIEALVVSDSELAMNESPAVQMRGAILTKTGFTPKRTLSDDEEIPWQEFNLIVTGRLRTKRVQSKERKRRRGEHEIVEASEFFADNSVTDFYRSEQPGNLRILADSFDFSCLEQKTLVAADNLRLLTDFIRQMATEAEYDGSYDAMRQLLELVWPSNQQTDSLGWRRERPGKYSVAAVTESSNELQFTRYSRLRYFVEIGLRPSGNETL